MQFSVNPSSCAELHQCGGLSGMGGLVCEHGAVAEPRLTQLAGCLALSIWVLWDYFLRIGFQRRDNGVKNDENEKRSSSLFLDFNFEMILDLQKSCKTVQGILTCPLPRFPQIYSFYYTCFFILHTYMCVQCTQTHAPCYFFLKILRVSCRCEGPFPPHTLGFLFKGGHSLP